MANALNAVLDHVAIAVPDRDLAAQRWHDELGGVWAGMWEAPTFTSAQLRFAAGGKLELLTPPTDPATGSFVRRFLERFGSQVHHVTLKVPALDAAIELIRDAGYDVVDIRRTPGWHEAFLRPSQAGGLVVQIAWASDGDSDRAAHSRPARQEPQPGALRLHGPLLRHPNLGHVRNFWTLLGATIEAPIDVKS